MDIDDNPIAVDSVIPLSIPDPSLSVAQVRTRVGIERPVLTGSTAMGNWAVQPSGCGNQNNFGGSADSNFRTRGTGTFIVSSSTDVAAPTLPPDSTSTGAPTPPLLTTHARPVIASRVSRRPISTPLGSTTTGDPLPIPSSSGPARSNTVISRHKPYERLNSLRTKLAATTSDMAPELRGLVARVQESTATSSSPPAPPIPSIVPSVIPSTSAAPSAPDPLFHAFATMHLGSSSSQDANQASNTAPVMALPQNVIVQISGAQLPAADPLAQALFSMHLGPSPLPASSDPLATAASQGDVGQITDTPPASDPLSQMLSGMHLAPASDPSLSQDQTSSTADAGLQSQAIPAPLSATASQPYSSNGEASTSVGARGNAVAARRSENRSNNVPYNKASRGKTADSKSNSISKARSTDFPYGLLSSRDSDSDNDAEEQPFKKFRNYWAIIESGDHKEKSGMIYRYRGRGSVRIRLDKSGKKVTVAISRVTVQ